ncbi:acyl-CoA thioesterase [Thiospirochaeta perfilievii]|uniref:Acyl-CoA thioesterase n=1 Tax=Thiospirochaeta perfilievii TaxID=252967 RepID=A0A5C1QDS2_9SPIO|nr:thioesterase family protein [Thiospirochaeta perfilievii]QEN05129.1 acyl-CoA thioesterase [Thiospirochaeta perfilievii]
MIYKTEIKVRHYECDAYGHVNNANYLNYLEHARSEFLKQIGFDYASFVAEGYGVYVVKISISYKSSALPEDALDIFTKVTERKKASGVFYQEIKRGETLICVAEVTWASIGKSGRMAPIPKEWDVPGLNV